MLRLISSYLSVLKYASANLIQFLATVCFLLIVSLAGASAAEEMPAEVAALLADGVQAPSSIPDSGSSYRLMALDLIRFSVRNEPDLTNEQRIDGDGQIRVPLLGAIKVESMSVREAEALLKRLYRENEIFRDAEVTLTITEYTPRTVYVLGQVNRPGKVELLIEEGDVDVARLLAMAGGVTRIARTDRVSITRIGENKKPETFSVNVERMFDASRSRSDSSRVLVYPGDVVFVPERLF